MLTSVRAALEELGLTSRGAALWHCINITAGDCMAVSLFCEDGRFFQVKVSEFLALDAEFERQTWAWRRFPQFVPRPLGYVVRDGWSILVSEGIRHAPLRAESLLRRSRVRPRIIDQLHGFFAAAGSAETNGAVSDETGGRLAFLEEAFAGTAHAQLASSWLEYGRRHGIDALPKRSQHGDFVLNNLGWTGSQLVIFDWEDFGKIDVAGLDLATLMLSLAGEDNVLPLASMSRANADPSPVCELIRASCAAYGVDFDQFRVLLPVYLLLFLHLKRNYGIAVRERIGTMLERISMP